jgi:nitrous oxide reductase
VKSPGYFVIVADLQGFNNSVGHLRNAPNEPWPVIRVHRGDRVNILVCNLDDYSPHGFAIQHYFDAGTALMPHESFRFSFVADQLGVFSIYCNIFCPVHPYMLSGQLIVSE